MEIGDYLMTMGRRLWILVALPLLAGGAVAALVLSHPRTYTATATVAAPAVVGGSNANQYGGANGAKVFVANFTAALTSPPIVDKVAKETSTSRDEVVNGLSATPIGDSSLIQVTFQTPKKDRAMPVARAAASDTIIFLFQTQVTLAEETAAEAQKAVNDADAGLAAFFKNTGLVLPDRLYELKAQALTSLQQQQLQERASGNPIGASLLQPAIDSKQAELRDLAPKVNTYQSLLDRKQQATAQFNTAQQGLQQALAQFKAASPATVVTMSDAQQVSLASTLVKKVGVALGAGLFLAVVIMFLLELLGASRRPSVRGTATAAREPAPALTFESWQDEVPSVPARRGPVSSEHATDG